VPLDVIADRLDHRFRLLANRDRTAVPRQQTLAATIEWSHDLLTDDERRLFRRLSVFAGRWTLEAAERICGLDDPGGSEVLDLLTRLVDKSMVVAEGSASGVERYRLLETLRQYGRARLAESGEGDALRERHFTYYLEQVTTAHAHVAAPRHRDEWLRRFDADNDNLRAALTWASEHQPDMALRFAVDLSWYWWHRRRHMEGVYWQETLLAHGLGDAQLQARALAHIGLLAREYGDLDRAQLALSEARARFDALGSRRGQAHVLNTLTLLYLGQGRLADARSAATECLRLNQELGDLARQMFALAHMGFVAILEEDFLAASSWQEQSLHLARTLGDRFRTMRQCYLLGAVRRLLGDYATAAELFTEAASLLDPKDPWARPWEWIFPADLAADEGRYAEAAQLYQTALHHNQRVGNRVGVSWVTQRLGILAIRMGDPRRGVRVLAATDEIGAQALRGNVPELAYERRRALDHARAVLGEEGFAAEWASGQLLPLEDAALETLPAAGAEQPVGRRPNGPLTQRQLDIAKLIVRGQTNRQIAEQLIVSPHTVERHVENILHKLQLSSRTEIAVWMVERRRG
jgi:non-specific serine/threonine protein kinase